MSKSISFTSSWLFIEILFIISSTDEDIEVLRYSSTLSSSSSSFAVFNASFSVFSLPQMSLLSLDVSIITKLSLVHTRGNSGRKGIFSFLNSSFVFIVSSPLKVFRVLF